MGKTLAGNGFYGKGLTAAIQALSLKVKNWSKGAYFLHFANNSGEKLLLELIKY